MISGFLIVVQDKDESNKGVPIGEFIIEGDGIRGVKCKDDKDNGVCHSNPELKSEVSVDWKNDGYSSVIIRATVVYEYSTGDHVTYNYNDEDEEYYDDNRGEDTSSQ